jgi:hypothetical protein
MKTKLGFGVGDFIIVKEGVDKYRYTTEGTLLLVADFGTRRWDGAKMVLGYCLNEGGQGKQMDIEAEDVRLATSAEVDARKREVAELRQLATKSAFRTGDSVIFLKDYKTTSHGPMESGTMTLRRGTKAIVDLAPNPDDDDEDDEENGSKGETTDVEDSSISAGKTSIRLRDFVGPMVRVYLTDLEDEFDVPLGILARPKEEFLGAKLVLPEGYMDRLTTLMRRVTNKEIATKIYEDLGLSRVCQKGRGAICLLYGPPGTGKTMTAEVVAEKMGRPLISLKLGALNNSEALAKKLAAGFQRAAKYKAVLLLDEVDVFIRKRGGHPVFDENTSTFLRVLEYFDGVLIMTTNLVNQIDEAVFSRVHLCLEYGSPQDADRRTIWQSMFSKELLDAVTGDDSAHDAMLDMLSKKKLNGREIKTVIQNAVGKAVARMVDGDKGLPKTKWINRAYFIEEAERLATMREELKRE